MEEVKEILKGLGIVCNGVPMEEEVLGAMEMCELMLATGDNSAKKDIGVLWDFCLENYNK